MTEKKILTTVKIVSYKEFEAENKPLRKVKLTVRLTQKEYRMLCESSKLCGIGPSVFVRKTVMDKIDTKK